MRWAPIAAATGIALAATAARAEDVVPAVASAVPAPVEPPPRPVAVRGTGVTGLVAFTFDDGPSAHTPRVLAVLARHDVPATFFVVGRELDGYRAPRGRRVLAAVAAAGHTIGNHTYGHARLPTLDEAALAAQVDGAADLITEITGVAPTLLRPPYGERSARVDRYLAGRGLTQVLWNVDPQEWRPGADAETVRHDVVRAVLAQGGGIVLLHDSKPHTATALAGILADLERANCKRLAAGRAAIVPVSLDYFLGGEVPPAVAERTQRYRDGLAARCQPRGRSVR